MTGPTFRALCNDQFINVRGGAGVGKKLAPVVPQLSGLAERAKGDSNVA
jgi:hypothetical protein